MRKALGLTGLLVALIVFTTSWEASHDDGRISFLTNQNIRNLLTWIGLFGIFSLAQAIVIITGGIDLSVGSLAALVGISAAMLLDKGQGLHPAIVIPAALGIGASVGLWHGVLVAKVKLQPFIVTLCGLFLYRGITRLITGDQSEGFGSNTYPNLRWLGSGIVGDVIAVPFIILILLAIIVGAFLHFTPVGRHLFALGANEEGARFSGIRTSRLIMLAYALCGLITAIGGLLLAFKVNSLGPSDFGNFYELYAIAGAVLGGCSLRGGSGTVIGVIIGASLFNVLKNLVNILEIPSQWEYVVIGVAILIGVGIDELSARRGATAKRVA
ncbi:MAG TPA: ABC transporter permease [Candidatus Hydrogenedentes bacterium]|nr:ABC transporter permease [Candidatus Hydrogenedentota bacterium]